MFLSPRLMLKFDCHIWESVQNPKEFLSRQGWVIWVIAPNMRVYTVPFLQKPSYLYVLQVILLYGVKKEMAACWKNRIVKTVIWIYMNLFSGIYSNLLQG